MGNKIFITGGSGFVGQHMISFFIGEGYEVMALARSEASAAKVTSKGAIAVRDDLTQLSIPTQEALESCDYVVHSAAYMDFNYEKEKFYQINVDASKHLLELAREAGIKKFIYISAAPVVAGSPVINLSEEEAGDDLPKALYPKTKAIAEKSVLAANEPGFQTFSLRPPAIWGPDNHHLDEMLDLVKKGSWVWIDGSHQILSTIHVYNLSAATLAAIENGEKGGTAYFVTDGDRRSMRTSFEAIFKAHGVEAGDREIPLGLAAGLASFFDFLWKTLRIKSRPPIPPLLIRLMAREFSVSDSKARKELQYQNVISFEEGIRSLVTSRIQAKP
ncbi:MAG: NAD-dependent epimerase/dehydratase family protein [Bacteroidota bacterium]